MLAMKKYVGMAKTRPASRSPRRLPQAIRTTNATDMGTVARPRLGTADTMASLPAATETATVIV